MKKVFITGVTSGIGLAITQSLLARGDEVWGTSRNLARISPLPRLHPVQLDLGSSRSIDEAFNKALSEAGHFDVVINNAGSGHFGPAENLTENEIADQFQVLLFGQLQLTRLALRAMRFRGEGLIINVTSLASRLPVPFMAAYNSAKAAMASFTMSMQLELAGTGVRMIDLQPADIRTDFNDSVAKNNSAHYEDKVAKTWKTVARNMSAAPKPELVADRLLRLIEAANPPPRLTVGGFFQAKIAPFIFRFLPHRLRLWGLRKYYGI